MEIVIRSDSYRARTEDRAEAFRMGEGWALVVADGVGGRPNGARAAETLVRRVGEALPGIRLSEDVETWRRLLIDIDQEMSEDRDGGETTAVVLGVTRRAIAGASVGDSEAWLVLDDDYLELTGGRSRKPFLGVGGAFPVPFSSPFAEGTLLLGTDGLFKYASPESICAAARGTDLEAAADALIDRVRPRSGSFQDDVAVILCRQ